MPGTSTEQVVDKGIRQKSTKEWTHSLTAVPFVRGHRSVFPRTPRNTGVYTHHPTFVTATSGVLTRLPAWLSKNRMRVYTLSDMRSKKKLRVYTASEAKGLTSLTSEFVLLWYFGFILTESRRRSKWWWRWDQWGWGRWQGTVWGSARQHRGAREGRPGTQPSVTVQVRRHCIHYVGTVLYLYIDVCLYVFVF